ncbi:MAG TPA: CDP-alcohol phosphatidyltransferase family protein [Candidatus Acidoferrum sp.]|nr:CDP-alcohol phosphatidyltransferase family protein [Candidatus Acidoferrum sp.]
MQMVVAIPSKKDLQHHGGAEQALLRNVSGVPLLVRGLATGIRAGVDRALIVHGPEFLPEVLRKLCSSKLFGGLKELRFLEVSQFNPASPGCWQEISEFLENDLLWVPWNWVTNKHGLANLKPVEERPMLWDRPYRMPGAIAVSPLQPQQAPESSNEGISVTSVTSAKAAGRWLVAHSGKPLDGIYSRFNRWLCRPFVRLLAHTPITPNMVTFAGLLVAIVSAYFFAQGNYLASLTGALLFFLSGLLDEVDGMLARVRFSDSAFGTWFEGSVDNLSYLLLFVGVTLGLQKQRGGHQVLLGGITLVGAILSIALISWQRKRLTHRSRPNEYCAKMYGLLEKDRSNLFSRMGRQLEFLIKKGVFIHYVVLFTALGLLPVLLPLAAFASNVTWILVLYFSFRFFRRREPGAGTVELSKAA